MPYASPNNNTYTNIPPLESLYVLFGIALSVVNPSEFARFQEFVRQSPEFGERYSQTFPSSDPTQAGPSAVDEAVEKQKWIDKAFAYVAPSLFVTSVLASGELVGSTIWGISKYVSKDIIWDTLGATTAAVILQSAELVGYREETQKLLGIDQTGKRAAFAIKVGDLSGKAIGAAAGTFLSVLIESFTVGLVAPTLVPFVTGAGFVAGLLIGGVIGAGVGAGLNNLFFSTIEIVPASYKGIKQKGGQFVERIKNSRVEKRKLKEAKVAATEKKNAVFGTGKDTGPPESSSAQLLLKGGDPALVQQPSVPASQAIKGPFVLGVKSQEGSQQQRKDRSTPVIAQQRNKDQNATVPQVNAIPGKGGDKTEPVSPKGQEAEDPNALPKKSGKKTSGNKSNNNKTAAQTKVKTPLPKPIAPKNQDSTPKNTKTKTNGQSVYEARVEVVTEEGGEWKKVPTKKELNAKKKQKKLEDEKKRKEAERLKTQKNNPNQNSGQGLNARKPNGQTDYPPISVKVKINPREKTKFTNDIPHKNAVKNALTEGKKNKGQPHAGKSRNRSGQNAQLLGQVTR